MSRFDARRLQAVVSTSVVLVVAVLLGMAPMVPPSLPAGDAAFSLDGAQAIVADLAREPHPTGTAEAARVRRGIVDRLVEWSWCGRCREWGFAEQHCAARP